MGNNKKANTPIGMDQDSGKKGKHRITEILKKEKILPSIQNSIPNDKAND
ncbi:hypothetical protein H9X57_04810 [Flavobacterium piscinae]|nr:hypothetical protein [Flavobacterium piscinae]MBC8882947.1 hypothetical protein [Flavobacterium piscinae]